MDEEYELTPHKKIMELEKELDYIKKHPIGSSSAGKNLVAAIETLNENIVSLIEIFREAGAGLNSSGEQPSDDLMGKKIDNLVGQNKEIAEALVSLADELKEHKETVSDLQSTVSNQEPPKMTPPEPMPQPNFPEQPAFPQDQGMPPMPDLGADINMPPAGGDMGSDMPPVPPPPKKKGLFGNKP